MEKPSLTQVLLRLPPDIKKWLDAQSLHNLSSKNSEVIRCIRQCMKETQPDNVTSPKP